MFKKSLLSLCIIFGFVASASAMDKPEETNTFTVMAKATMNGFTFTSAGEEDFGQLAELVSGKTFHEGFPGYDKGSYNSEELRGWFDSPNLARQEGPKKNLFHCYKVSHPKAGDIGFIHFGRMPSVAKYDPVKHAAIIEQFMTLGVTQKKDPAKGLEPENIERIANRGLAQVLPILRDGLSEDIAVGVFNAAYTFAQSMAGEEYTLPIEGTNPHQLIGLFAPEDPLLPFFEKAGFAITMNEGFVEFYPPKQRVMIHKPL